MNRLTIRVMSAEVDPTAPSAVSLPKRPTTTVSAALNNSWSMPDSIMGTEKRRKPFMIGPLVMSMFLLCLAMKFSLRGR